MASTGVSNNIDDSNEGFLISRLTFSGASRQEVANATKSPFLRLPEEMRRMIWDYILTPQFIVLFRSTAGLRSVSVSEHTNLVLQLRRDVDIYDEADDFYAKDKGLPLCSAVNQLAFCLLSRQVCSDTIDMLYQRNTFSFPSRHCLQRLMEVVPHESWKGIRKVVLTDNFATMERGVYVPFIRGLTDCRQITIVLGSCLETADGGLLDQLRVLHAVIRGPNPLSSARRSSNEATIIIPQHYRRHYDGKGGVHAARNARDQDAVDVDEIMAALPGLQVETRGKEFFNIANVKLVEIMSKLTKQVAQRQYNS